MITLYYLVTLALILLHFTAVGTGLLRWIPSLHIARAVGVTGITLVVFFVEHFHGLGRLTWLWPVTTTLSVLLLWVNRDTLTDSGALKAEAVFWAFVAYGLLWKWCFPSIYPTSERFTDLYFIANYFSGATLPPPDLWLPPHRFDFYYAFQHYGAALMGRLFHLQPGLTYNLASPLLTGMTAALAWDFATRYTDHRGWRIVLIASFVIGGTGTTPFTRLVHEGPIDASAKMVGSARFAGVYDQQYANVPGWQDVFLPSVPQGFERRELPSEDFGYQYYVGDYHPPLGGFFLLALTFGLLGLIENGIGHTRLNTALLAATVPITIAVNTWVFPMQFLLVAGWAAWRSRTGGIDNEESGAAAHVDWPALISGGLTSLALIYPFLARFTAESQPAPMRIVGAIDHTPVAQFLAVHWPMLLLIGIGIALGLRRAGRHEPQRALTLYFALALAALLFVTEMLYIDDPSGGRFERTNSVMKWWGWLWSATVISLGSLLLGSSVRWARWLTGTTLAITCLYAVDVANYFRTNAMLDRGQLHGTAVYTAADGTARDMFHYLAAAPKGVVMENLYGDAYTDSTAYAIFAAQPALLGWPLHLVTWHGALPETWLTRNAVIAFYAGTLPDARQWLLARDVRYIIWNRRDAREHAQSWATVHNEIGASYTWHGFGPPNQDAAGLWVRR